MASPAHSSTKKSGFKPGSASSGNVSLTLGSLLRFGRHYLAGLGLEEAALEAEVLLMHQAGISRAYLYSHREDAAPVEFGVAYQTLLDRRAAREPLAYITGTREFFGLEFRVDRRVLIPRPETEMLVEECLGQLGQDSRPFPILADIGTGSGAIAVALAHHLPGARVYATDISAEAIDVASINCARHGVRERVTLVEGNLLEALPEPVDVILANLPYVPRSTISTLAPEVSVYEPRAALDGGEDGLYLVRQLLSQTPGRLRPGGRLLLEIGSGQGAEAAQAAADAIAGSSIRVMRDLAGLDRLLVIELAT